MTTENAPTFDINAIVEIFGHVRIAGRVSEQVIAGQGFIRIDVPENSEYPAFTRFYGPNAIYSITPVTEEIMRAASERMRERPVTVYIPAQLQDRIEPDAEYIEGEEDETWEDEDDDSPF